MTEGSHQRGVGPVRRIRPYQPYGVLGERGEKKNILHKEAGASVSPMPWPDKGGCKGGDRERDLNPVKGTKGVFPQKPAIFRLSPLSATKHGRA